MPKYFCFSLFFGLLSCGFFEFKKISQEELLREEMELLKQMGVSEYPLFEACKSYSTKAAQQDCFERTLGNHIASYFGEHRLAISGKASDTLWIPLLIDAKGKLQVGPFALPDAYQTSFEPSVQQLLEESLELLPPLEPAHIRGVPIATRYQLPLVLNTDD